MTLFLTKMHINKIYHLENLVIKLFGIKLIDLRITLSFLGHL